VSGAVEVLAFTDGAAKGNPGPGGWGAVILVGGAAVKELGGGGGHTTNNRMEMTAAAAALEWLAGSDPADITIATDSTYVMKGVTEWLRNWKRRGWKTAGGGEVANRDLWMRIDEAVSACPRVRWRYIPGHAGFPGNERADEIASEFALAHVPVLYTGPYEGYGRDLRDLPEAGTPIRAAARQGAKPGAKAGTKSGAHSYVSVVDGVVVTHANWPDCERRVKGRSGARYRKTTSAADERALLAEWGERMDDPGAGR